MGQRFAKKACQLLNPNHKLDPTLYKEHFVDSHRDISSHAAIGKTISGTATDSKHSSNKGLNALLDGKFGSADHTEKTWSGFAPSEKPIQILIDLGQSTVINELGVNMLLSTKAKAEFPNKIIFSTSDDGKTFKINNQRYNTIKFYNTKKLKAMRANGIEAQSVLLLTGQGSAKARYLKIEIETGDQWVFLDEIVVNPVVR